MPSSRYENRKKVRRTEYLSSIPHRFYIFCEGTQTEPLYFKGFASAIRLNPIYKNLIHIEVIGVGADTIRVMQAAEKYVRDESITNANVWCVYDKDNFPAHHFNAVSETAQNLNSKFSNVNFSVAWSNQCIEYWFILHFAFYTSDNDRKYYRQFLHKKFAKLGWTRYEKNNEELFSILTRYGNPKKAIQYAEDRILEFKDQSDSATVPGTKVFLLVRELANYLPEDIKIKYL